MAGVDGRVAAAVLCLEGGELLFPVFDMLVSDAGSHPQMNFVVAEVGREEAVEIFHINRGGMIGFGGFVVGFEL